MLNKLQRLFNFQNQIGAVSVLPLLVIISAVGVIAFLVIASTSPFEKGLFGDIFSKQPSQAASNQIYWGAWIDGKTVYGSNYSTVPYDCNSTGSSCPTLDLFQSHAGKKASILHFGFGCWISSSSCHQFNDIVGLMNAIVSRGSIPMLDLGTYNRRDIDIASGMDDAYITTWAKEAKAWGHPFILRLDTEMNGSWETYGPNNSYNNTPGDFIKMWRHIHDIFESQGAKNVTWAWVPNWETQTQADDKTLVNNDGNWYPGDAYVDWTGFDAYNFSSIKKTKWMTWDEVAGPVYKHLLSIAPSKPMIVGEVASTETGAPSGTSKSAWITDTLANLPTKYPHIKAFVWFNWNVAGSPTADWAIETSSSSQTAFAKGIASSYFATNVFANPPVNAAGKILPLGGTVPTPIPTVKPTPTSTPKPTAAPTSKPVPTTTPVSVSGSVSFVPVADTYIAQDDPDSNYGGTAPFLYINSSTTAQRQSFMRFDLSSVGGKVLTKAILRVHTTSESNAGSRFTQNVKFVTDNLWKEQYMTWNNTVNSSSILSTPIGTLVNADKLSSTYDISLSLSNIQVHLGGLYSIMMDATNNDDLVIASRESGSTTTPQLILTFK